MSFCIPGLSASLFGVELVSAVPQLLELGVLVGQGLVIQLLLVSSMS
jgi:hypothetical protein